MPKNHNVDAHDQQQNPQEQIQSDNDQVLNWTIKIFFVKLHFRDDIHMKPFFFFWFSSDQTHSSIQV